MSKKIDNSDAQYVMVERAFEVLRVLKEETDETSSLTQAEILDKIETTKNAKTLSSTIDKMPSITDLRYVHDFTYDELDTLIEGVYFSKKLNDEKRDYLIKKIGSLSSEKYKSDHFDLKGKLKNNIDGIQENTNISKAELKKNIDTIQQAIKENSKISFAFNGYNYEKKLETIKDDGVKDKEYVVSPYHMVAYNGKYYLIANTDFYDNVSIYRMDLMTSLSIKGKNSETGKEKIRRKPVRDVNGLSEAWNASDFMSAHLNMFYDKPETIHLKIRNNRYTILHDWFGERYKFKNKLNDEYDEVSVVCSPHAMVYWAMQYGDYVEVLRPDSVREKIAEKCKSMVGKYGR
jgi:predicted DNA-binding transcriptional regulator YafY